MTHKSDFSSTNLHNSEKTSNGEGPLPFQPVRLTWDHVREFLFEKIFITTPSNYYKEHPKWPGLVGLELEAIPLDISEPSPTGTKDHRIVIPNDKGNIRLAQKEGNLRRVLLGAAQKHAWEPRFEESTPSESSPLLSLNLGHEDQVTFEPGGQLEISTKPYPCLNQAAERLIHVQAQLDAALAEQSLELLHLGINPWLSPEEIGLQMLKPRYQAMTRYFGSINEGIGLRMMRQTCTVQVNLDFGPDEATLAKRLLAAQFIAPFATSIFAYSPYVDGKKTSFKSMRAEIWQRIDPSRTGFLPTDKILQALNREACVGEFEHFLANSQVVFIPALQYEVPRKPLKFADWLGQGYKGIFPTLDDLKVCLSLLFPEVRTRGFIELRSIDCQARIWQFVPAAFYCGLLYDSENLDLILEELAALSARDSNLQNFWSNSRFGLQDPFNAKMADKLMGMSLSGISRLPKCFRSERLRKDLQTYYGYFTQRARTPADDLLDICQQRGQATPRLGDIRALEARWTEI